MPCAGGWERLDDLVMGGSPAASLALLAGSRSTLLLASHAGSMAMVGMAANCGTGRGLLGVSSFLVATDCEEGENKENKDDDEEEEGKRQNYR